jgi:hypothetical protein
MLNASPCPSGMVDPRESRFSAPMENGNPMSGAPEETRPRHVPIPFASASLLLETKRTWREKDQIDSAYLRALLEREKKS